MKTIRRLYFYLVAIISLEVVVWGLINLLRTMFSSGLTFPGADTLAQALALIFVGVPIFAVHWRWTQNAAHKDPDENSATLRALFLYSVLLMTLIPVTQNFLAFLNRTLVVGAGIDSSRAFIGGGQSWVDNLIAILLNLIAAAYFFNILRGNWDALKEQDNFRDIRRIYRYIWTLYSLLMLVFGTQQILSFVFHQPTAILGEIGRETFINGLALILIGAPLWYYTWGLCQNALADSLEKGSALRLGVLYLLGLAGVIVVISMGGIIINVILRRLLGESIAWAELITQIGSPLSVGLPLAVVWAYYGHWLQIEIASGEDEARQAAKKRFYYYILAFIGLVATFTGLALLISFIITIMTGNGLWGDQLRSSLCASIATLLAGLPLWLAAWSPMQAEAGNTGDAGDHARRSLVRRFYLYLIIFATVIGGMISAIYLVYTVLFGFLDHRSESFVSNVLNGIQLLGLFAAFLAYHWNLLRQDGGHAADALATRQANFAVLIIESQGSGFGEPILAAIKRSAASTPAAIQTIEQGMPEAAIPVQAVILPSSLALNPPEALRLWLKNFQGAKIIIPIPEQGWYWPGLEEKKASGTAANIVRQLAEGQEVRVSGSASGWQIAVYVLAALFGLQILLMVLSLGISLISN